MNIVPSRRLRDAAQKRVHQRMPIIRDSEPLADYEYTVMQAPPDIDELARRLGRDPTDLRQNSSSD